MRKTVSPFVLAGAIAIPAAFIGYGANNATADASAQSAALPELVVVKHHADWCGKCKALVEPLHEAKEQLANESVLFVTYDFSDKNTAMQSEYLAGMLRLDDQWESFGKKTGFALVIDTESMEVVETLRSTDSSELVAQIRSHLD